MNVRTRWAIILAPALVLVMAWYLFVWNGHQDDVAAANGRAETLLHQASQIRSEVRDATKFKNAGKESRARLAALRAAYPNDTAISDFIRSNDELATTTGALVDSLTPEAVNSKDTAAPSTTRTIGISLKASGSEQAVYNYVGRLQSLARTTAIDNIALTSESAGAISVSIRLRIFVAKDDSLGS